MRSWAWQDGISFQTYTIELNLVFTARSLQYRVKPPSTRRQMEVPEGLENTRRETVKKKKNIHLKIKRGKPVGIPIRQNPTELAFAVACLVSEIRC